MTAILRVWLTFQLFQLNFSMDKNLASRIDRVAPLTTFITKGKGLHVLCKRDLKKI